MIRNWFQKKNEIVFLCDERYFKIFEYCKPNYSGTFMPEWFKKLPLTYKKENNFGLKHSIPTVRTCYGIRKTLTNGFILPLWSDIIIEVDSEGSWKYQCSDGLTAITSHDMQQYIGLFEKCHVFKIISPWFIQSNKTLSLFISQPLYHHGDTNDFFVLPGLLSFNKYPVSTNFFIGIPIKNVTQRIELKYGFPIVQYINTEEKNFKIKTKLINTNTSDSFRSQISFIKSFEKMLKHGKENE